RREEPVERTGDPDNPERRRAKRGAERPLACSRPGRIEVRHLQLVVRLRLAPHHQPRERRKAGDQRNTHGRPRPTPASREHECADGREGDHDPDAHDERVHAHRPRQPPPEPLPRHGQLTIDNALCPNPRVRVIRTTSMAAPRALLMAITTAPSPSATVVSTRRLPWRSISPPIPKQKSEPTSVATRLISANRTRSIDRSRNSGSVISPRPCVRPGSVPTIARAATPSTTQP